MNREYCFNFKDKNVVYDLSKTINSLIKKNCVLLFLGTDKCIGDSFAPMVGSLISSFEYIKNPIYGTIKTPIHSLNIDLAIKEIKKLYPHLPIFAIDSMISKNANVGDIIIKKTGIFPGKALNKQLPVVGDISLTLVVSNNEKDAISSLTSLRLNDIYEMAKVVSNSFFISFGASSFIYNDYVLK